MNSFGILFAHIKIVTALRKKISSIVIFVRLGIALNNSKNVLNSELLKFKAVVGVGLFTTRSNTDFSSLPH